jgi:hypothetical protein
MIEAVRVWNRELEEIFADGAEAAEEEEKR